MLHGFGFEDKVKIIMCYKLPLREEKGNGKSINLVCPQGFSLKTWEGRVKCRIEYRGAKKSKEEYNA